MGHSNREVEIKLPLDSAAEGKKKLRAAGFRLQRRRVFERNTVFDTPGHRLRRSRTLLRLREAGGEFLVTYKGPPSIARHKSREELETTVADAARMHLIFTRLGFVPVFRYEKYRTEYTDGHGTATLDETPIGCFLELEGPPRWIDRTARSLAYTRDAYITASYLRLYYDDCARRGRRPTHMTFQL